MERRWQVLLVTSVAVFMGFLDVTIVNIAFPDIRSSFPEASLGRLSWVLNAYTIVYAAALVPAGRLADRIGRRRSFLLGTIAFLAASALAGAAGTVDLLIGARVLQALGAAILVPTSLSLLLPEFPLALGRVRARDVERADADVNEPKISAGEFPVLAPSQLS